MVLHNVAQSKEQESLHLLTLWQRTWPWISLKLRQKKILIMQCTVQTVYLCNSWTSFFKFSTVIIISICECSTSVKMQPLAQPSPVMWMKSWLSRYKHCDITCFYSVCLCLFEVPLMRPSNAPLNCSTSVKRTSITQIWPFSLKSASPSFPHWQQGSFRKQA